MRPYDNTEDYFDPKPLPTPRRSNWGIVAAWAFAILTLIGTAIYLAKP